MQYWWKLHICFEFWRLSIYHVKPCRVHITMVENEITIALELWRSLMWDPTNVNNSMWRNFTTKVNGSCKCLKIWSLNTLLNPANSKLLWWTLELPINTWGLDSIFSMHVTLTQHCANLLSGMWRNPSAKLAKVADDVLRFRTCHIKYKLSRWRLNILQIYTYSIWSLMNLTLLNMQTKWRVEN